MQDQDAKEIGMAIQVAMSSLPDGFEVNLLIARGSWIVSLWVPSHSDDVFGHEQHIAVEGDCHLQCAIDEATSFAMEVDGKS